MVVDALSHQYLQLTVNECEAAVREKSDVHEQHRKCTRNSTKKDEIQFKPVTGGWNPMVWILRNWAFFNPSLPRTECCLRIHNLIQVRLYKIHTCITHVHIRSTLSAASHLIETENFSSKSRFCVLITQSSKAGSWMQDPHCQNFLLNCHFDDSWAPESSPHIHDMPIPHIHRYYFHTPLKSVNSWYQLVKNSRWSSTAYCYRAYTSLLLFASF